MGKQKRSENTYQKINTIFKRDANNVIMPYDEFALPGLEWLRDCKFDAEEKVDGTNTRIEVTREFITSDIGNNIGIKWNVAYKGKTDNSQIPKMLYTYLTTELTEDKVLNALGLSKEMYVTDELMQEKHGPYLIHNSMYMNLMKQKFQRDIHCMVKVTVQGFNLQDTIEKIILSLVLM